MIDNIKFRIFIYS